MSARDELDRWQAEAQTNAVLGRTATQDNARQMLAAVKALRAVLDLHQPYTWHNDTPRKGMRQWGPGVGAEGEGTCDVERETWPCPTVRAIEAAIGGEGRG